MRIILTAIVLLFSLTACSSDVSDEQLKEQAKKLLISFSKINYEVKKEEYKKTPNDFTAYIIVIQDKAKPYITEKETKNFHKTGIGHTASFLAYNDIFLTVEDVEITNFKRNDVSGSIDIGYKIYLKGTLNDEVMQQAGRVTLLPDNESYKIDSYWDNIKIAHFRTEAK
ncbi:hypothetical protein [Brevibacillus daliensis]|uniref:hypothetical protein n=1 Tax=Brevibacillus daliensis TaxID=2892995 RepID=UPI001E33B287|nr:hypothetical protein [Brevibacillus daliensis]